MKCFIVFYCVPIKNIIFECTKATIVKIEAFLITQDNVHILVGVSQKSLNYTLEICFFHKKYCNIQVRIILVCVLYSFKIQSLFYNVARTAIQS